MNNKAIRAITILMCLFASYPHCAAQSMRAEIDITRDDYVVAAGPMGSEAAFACNYNSKPSGKSNAVEFICFDQNLKEIKRIPTTVPVGCKYQAYASDSNGAVVVFSKTLSGDFAILYCDGNTSHTISGNMGPKAYCREVFIFKGCALLSCRDKKGNSFVITANFSSKSSENILLSGADSKADINILDIQYTKLNNQYAVVFVQEEKDVRTLRVQNLGADLKKSNVLELSKATKSERFLNSATLNMITSGEYIVSGTYQNQKGEYSNGMYIGKFSGSTWGTINYYDWVKDFQHVTDFMSNKQKDKVDKKKEKADSKGNSYDLDIMMLTHPLLLQGENYVIVGEMYYPEYQTYTDSKGVTTRTFVGYRYTQALITSFSKDLKKNWDQSFAIGVLGGFRAVPMVTVNMNSSGVTCAFVVGSTIHYKVVGPDGLVPTTTTTSYSVRDEGEEVRSMYADDMYFWYGDIYLAAGTARKKNNKSGDKESVFYLATVQLKK